MGWNRVIKTVKGHQYAYMQRSWREGKHVRTESRFIGAVFGEGGTSNREVVPAEPPPGSADTSRTTPPTKPVPASKMAQPQGVRLRFDPTRAKVSTARLESDHKKAREWASRLGVPSDRFPGLVVASGASLANRRARFSNNMVVIVPKGERNRSAIRKEIHKATGRAMLDSLRKASPERFCAVAGAMDASFRETNRLLFRYLAGQEKADRLVLSLQIYAFGYISAPRTLRKSPERLGVAGFGDDARRHSWEGEAVAIIAEAQGKGWAKVAEARADATHEAFRRERAAMRRYLETRSLFDRFTGKRRTMRKKLVQAVQSRQLCEEAERKAGLLRSALKAD
jgi:hypothetical protein